MSDVNATPANLRTPFPQDVAPFDPVTGKFSQVWLEFFLRLFKRSGGTSGADVSALLTLIRQLEQAIASILLEDSYQDARANAMVPIESRHPFDAAAIGTVSVMRPIFDVELKAIAVTRRAATIAPEPVPIPAQSTTSTGDMDDWSEVAKADLPTASTANTGWRRFVTDATGSTGIVPAYCDGTVWKRFSDDSEIT